MYNFQSSLVLNENGWVDLDISTQTFHSLYLTYKKVYLNLFEDVQDKDYQLDLDTLKPSYYFSEMTINEFLIANGNLIIPHLSEEIKNLKKIKRARYIDCSHNEIKVRPIRFGYGYTPDKIGYATPELELLGTTHTTENTVATINGFLHRVETINDTTYIRNGYDTILRNGVSQYGIHDFSEIATLVTTPITADNLITTNFGYEVKLPEVVDSTDLVILSLNGLMFILGEGIYLSSKQAIGIKKRYFNWSDIVFNTKDKLNTSLTLTTLTGLENAALISEINSERIQRELLTSINSFVTIIKPKDTTQPIALQKEQLYDNGVGYGAYRGYYPPNGIIRNNIKQCCNYVNSLADDECVVRTEQYQTAKYVYKTAGDRTLRTPVDTLVQTWLGTLTPTIVGGEMGYWCSMKDTVQLTPTPIVKDDIEIGIFISKNIDLSNPASGGYFKFQLMRYLSGDVNSLASYELVTLDSQALSRVDILLTSGIINRKITATRNAYGVIVNDTWESIEVNSNNINNVQNAFINFMVDNPGELDIKIDFYRGVIPSTEYLNQYVDGTVDLMQDGWVNSHLTSLNYYQLK